MKTSKKLVLAALPAVMGLILVSGASAATTSAETGKFKSKAGKSQKAHHNTAALATILGMTEADLKAALSSGKTVDTLITEKGLNKTTVKETLRTQHATEKSSRLASALGISAATIDADLKAGLKLDAIATSNGLTEEALKTKLDAARQVEMKADLATRVASGKLTQAQADSILANKSKGGKRGFAGEHGPRGAGPKQATTQ